MVCLYRGENNDKIILEHSEKVPSGAIRLLVILLAELTHTGQFDVEVSMKQMLYMKGVASNSTNTGSILEGLAFLDQVRFQYRHSQSGWQTARIGIGSATYEKGVLYFQFHRSMATLIPARQFMHLPQTAMQRQFKNENVDARLFLTWRICQHKRMNLGKPNADLVPVRTLLACCPAIISYRDLKDKQPNQRIVEPLQRTRDLAPYYSCAFEFDQPDVYEDIMRSRIRVTWSKECPYPMDGAFIKRKAKKRAGKSNEQLKHRDL